jgi:ABC-type nickel/cobalt efflux system permease component RcnA
MVVAMKNSLQVIGRVILVIIAMWMFIDSTRVALRHEDAKAEAIAKHSKAMADNAPDVN